MAWALRHGAIAAERRPLVFDSEPALLHVLFGDAAGCEPEIRPISWMEFFARFDLLGLQIALDDSPAFQLIQPDKASIYPMDASRI